MRSEELYQRLETQYFSNNKDEENELKKLPALLKDVKVFLDIGASIGQYTFHVNNIIKNGTIYAIEADPIRYKKLAELCKDWEKRSSNKIYPIHAAVSENDGKTKFHITNSYRSGGIFKYEGEDNQLDWEEVSVESITLDTFFKDIDFDLAKIDVEGVEYRVILGASEIMKKGKSRFLIEVHPWGDIEKGKMPEDLFSLFASNGYSFKRVEHHWLFEKSTNRAQIYLKNRLISIVWRNKWIKTMLIKFVNFLK